MGFVVFLQAVDCTVFWNGKIVVGLKICCPLEQVRGETNNPYLRLLEEAMAVSSVDVGEWEAELECGKDSSSQALGQIWQMSDANRARVTPG